MDIKEIAEKINKKGGRLYLVGGAVRDQLLGKKPSDEDYCVTGLSKDEFLELFPNSHLKGKNFAVFDLEGIEFALARRETKTGKGHGEFLIDTKKEISIEEDLSRRDITINSIAKEIQSGKIIDPFGGIEDLKKKILRATTERFKEDPLRVYRIARFSAYMDYKIDERTIILMNSLKNELYNLPKERIYAELRKALTSQKPSNFFENLKLANLLDVHFNEIYSLIESTQRVKSLLEGDAFNHTMVAINKATKLTKRAEVIYAVLVHDLGKYITPKTMISHHNGNYTIGIELVKKMSKTIGVPNVWEKCGIISAEVDARAEKIEKMEFGKQVDLIEKLAKSPLGLDGMQIVIECARNENDKTFPLVKIGECMLKQINGRTINLNEIEEKKRYEVLRKERIKWLKNLQYKDI